jgi:hypothetical protein
MTSTLEELYTKYHEDNLSQARVHANRNNELNGNAGASFQLAYGSNGLLSPDKVQADYESLGVDIGLDKSAVKATIKSAQRFGKDNPRTLNTNGSQPPTQKQSVDLKLAPVYSELGEYAKAHGVPESEFIRFGWEVGTHDNRPCFILPHEDGIKRARFIDGNQPKWKPIGKTGGKRCWYGFKRAIKMAIASKHKTIVITNGQPSVIAAQFHGVPALAQTDGEGNEIQNDLLRRLQTELDKHKLKVCLAYDGDKAGREATKQKTKQLKANGIMPQVVMFGGDDGFDLADYCKRAKKDSLQWLLNLAKFSRREVETVMTGRTLADEFEQSLKFPGKSVMPGEMVVTPMKQLHDLGGYAKALHPAMMTEIIAPSGGGKTSFMETWVDEFRKSGLHVLWYSPEWSPMVMHLRSIQRHGGINADMYWDNVLWHKEAELDIHESQRKGVPLSLTSDAGKAALAVNNTIKRWPGEIHCFQSPAVTETILEQMTARLQYLRRLGVRVGVAFFDYAQLLHTVSEEAGRNSYEIIVSKVKTWCKDNWIHGVIGSQVTKELARACIDKGRLLGKYDSTWVAPNEFNLILSLNIVYDGKDIMTGEPVKTNKAKINVCKNSTGQEGVKKMVTDFKRLRWLDKDWRI